ncbi:hypothetical protein DSL72_006023 [Monilinia vaccinii-corymbosi]|uniref:RNA exonuclease 4 n=1 Tax=Monilinia vaccinii-corymbosi TaxID=61207 RepID=A0A8A3PHG4_9HELO|nr:hypothetical protein DSL72_006023 [Monilinia vaccinii-corymbosi]
MSPILSSNWKTLQSTLKKNTSQKRKAAEPSERTKDSIAKRRRVEGSPSKSRAIADAKGAAAGATKKNKMGGVASAHISDAPGADPSSLTRNAPSASLALWAEDNGISAQDLAEAYGGAAGLKDATMQGARADNINGGFAADVEMGKYIGMDCEMVGVGGAEDRSVLARVSLVNFHGTQIYDSFVRPKEFVTDWRTHVSGVSTKNMATAREFDEVQKDVSAILKGRILVGHAIRNDLEAMMLSHPKRDTRDTSKFSAFRKYSNGRTPSLKKLAKEILGVDIQGGEHSSIEDARATMLLFRNHKSAFEIEHAKHNPPTSRVSSKSQPKKKKKGKR